MLKLARHLTSEVVLGQESSEDTKELSDLAEAFACGIGKPLATSVMILTNVPTTKNDMLRCSSQRPDI